jgi:hypothetical protein
MFRGLPAGLCGNVTAKTILKITGSNNKEIISEDIFDLKASFFKTFGGLI